MSDFDIERSWACEPLLYRAPEPPPLNGDGRARDYQHAAVEYCLGRNHALIGDEPGLGKTAEAILISNAMRARRTLVVCPASLRLNWEREVWRWSTVPNVRTYPTMAARDGISSQAHYQIISYDLLRNEHILAALMDQHWDHLILDEAHYLKDPKGNKRTRAVCAPDALPSVVGRITMLSGTITPNQPIECYNTVRLLNWSALDCMSLERFRDHFYEVGKGGFIYGKYLSADNRGDPTWKYGRHWSSTVRNVPRNLDELRQRLRSRVMIRRLKKDVLRELPPRQWHIFPLSSTAKVRAALRHEGIIKAENLFDLDADQFDATIPIDGAISTARRMLGEAKAPQVAEYVQELLQEGVNKIVVGAWHLSVLAILANKLQGAKIPFAYMDGRTSGRARQAGVDDFQDSESELRIMLGQMQPLGEGWTLTAAQDVVLAEPHWVPGRNVQLFDRVHRMGQKGEHVICHVPVIPDSLDERVLASVIEKDVAIHRMTDRREQ